MADANELFAAHRERVFRYLSRFVRQGEAARDLTQEVFLRVSRGPIPSTTNHGELAWVFRIAKNLALNHARQTRRRPCVAVTDRPAVATQELSMALQEAIATLSDTERQAFLLREVKGLGYDEIAVICDVTPIAVRSRVHRARIQLREVLGGTLRPNDGVANVRLQRPRGQL